MARERLGLGVDEVEKTAVQKAVQRLKPPRFSLQSGPHQEKHVDAVDKTVPDDGKGRFRSLSIASAPYEEDLQFVMRQGESSFKRTLWSLSVGDEVFVMKPVGSFVLSEEDDATPVVFLIGGVGITPARSMLRQAMHLSSQRQFFLFYSNRLLKDAAFHEEMKAMPTLTTGSRYVIWADMIFWVASGLLVEVFLGAICLDCQN